MAIVAKPVVATVLGEKMLKVYTNSDKVAKALSEIDGIEVVPAQSLQHALYRELLRIAQRNGHADEAENTDKDDNSPSDLDVTVRQDGKGRVFYAAPDGSINCNCPQGECAISELQDEDNSAQPPSMQDEHMTDLMICEQPALIIEDALRWWLNECQWSSVHGQVSYILQRFLRAPISEIVGARAIEKIDRYDIDLLSRVLLDFSLHANVHSTLRRLASIEADNLDRMC